MVLADGELFGGCVECVEGERLIFRVLRGLGELRQ